MDKIDIRIERASSPAAGRLIAALDQDIVGRYPGMAVNGIDVAGFEADGGVFAIGYVDGEPAMCGAFRRYKDAAEIKRMFVVPAVRGCGLGRRMLRFLEDEAARRGFARAMLETGKKQVEAILSIRPPAGRLSRRRGGRRATRPVRRDRSCGARCFVQAMMLPLRHELARWRGNMLRHADSPSAAQPPFSSTERRSGRQGRRPIALVRGPTARDFCDK
jgi:GNAT superfamily N-acetyltransferase